MKKRNVIRLAAVMLVLIVAVTCLAACEEPTKVIPDEVQAQIDKLNAIGTTDAEKYLVSAQETLSAGQLTFIQCDVDLTKVYYYVSAIVNKYEDDKVVGVEKGVSVLFVNDETIANKLNDYFREFMGIAEGKSDNGKYTVAQGTMKDAEGKDRYLVFIGTIEGVNDIIA